MNSEEQPIETIPQAQIIRSRYPFPLIWLVPLCAALFSGYVLYHYYQGLGPVITVSFNNANGLKPGQSPVQYRGVDVGLVTDIRLSQDMKKALAIIRLKRIAEPMSQKGAQFWIVHPEVDETNIRGLGTVFTGPYISSVPGNGDSQAEFTGLDREPRSGNTGDLKLLLRTPHLGPVSEHSYVYYRGVQVGKVSSIEVGKDASQAEVEISVRRPYAKLVTAASRFWSLGIPDLHGSVFNGFNLKVDSLRSLVMGGIAFATPSEAAPVSQNQIFTLHESADDEWLEWSPRIKLSEALLEASRDEVEAQRSNALGQVLIKKEK